MRARIEFRWDVLAAGALGLLFAQGAAHAASAADTATVRLLVENGATLPPAEQWRLYRNAYRRYRISYPLGGHVEAEGDDGGALTEAPSVVIVLPRADSSTDRSKSEPDPHYAVHIRVEPDSDGLMFSEWLKQRRARDADFTRARVLPLKGRAAIRVKMKDESGEKDCVFTLAGGVLGICLETQEWDVPRDVKAEAQRTFQRMLRTFESLPNDADRRRPSKLPIKT
jgi:hypothetical protein